MDFLKDHVTRIVAEAENVPQGDRDIASYIDELSLRVKPFSISFSAKTSKSSADVISGPLAKIPVPPVLHQALRCRLYDLAEEAAILTQAGCGLPEHEIMLLQDSIYSLVSSSPSLKWARFWGKILARQGDYSILEVDYGGKDSPISGEEARGYGANRYTYFALSSTTGEWTELPHVTKSQLVSSRNFKTLLTGNLNAPAPKGFPGFELHLLRTTIARISSSTVIAPNGFFTVSDDGEITKAEEFTFPSDAPTLDNWVHAREYILKIGLTSYPEPAEGEEDSADIAQAKETDPAIDKLRVISEDSPSGWSLKVTGDRATYTFPDGDKSYAVSLIRSTRWPGAVTVSQGGKFVNFYCGYGVCADGPLFLPTEPLPVFSEPPEIDELPEPFPFEDDTAKEVPAE